MFVFFVFFIYRLSLDNNKINDTSMKIYYNSRLAMNEQSYVLVQYFPLTVDDKSP